MLIMQHSLLFSYRLVRYSKNICFSQSSRTLTTLFDVNSEIEEKTRVVPVISWYPGFLF
jgi:hypothetical protein